VSNRRALFREHLARLNPAANPATALNNGYYVPRPDQDSPAHRITKRIELRPNTSHLIVGGIGSGKTTELLVMRRALEQIGDVHPLYIDVTRRSGFNHHRSDSLARLILEALSTELATHPALKDREKAKTAVTTYQTAVKIENVTIDQLLLELRMGLVGWVPNLVVLIDSLDRLNDADEFNMLVAPLLAPLRRHGIGVAVVGPPHLLYGDARASTERFDHLHYLSYIDSTREDSKGRAFLSALLRARVPSDVLPDATCHMLGLDDADIERLQRIRRIGAFSHSTEDMHLLVTRRVLEIQDEHGVARYSVHSTFEPLLARLAEAL
jgi:hypothetical protein